MTGTECLPHADAGLPGDGGREIPTISTQRSARHIVGEQEGWAERWGPSLGHQLSPLPPGTEAPGGPWGLAGRWAFRPPRTEPLGPNLVTKLCHRDPAKAGPLYGAWAPTVPFWGLLTPHGYEAVGPVGVQSAGWSLGPASAAGAQGTVGAKRWTRPKPRRQAWLGGHRRGASSLGTSRENSVTPTTLLTCPVPDSQGQERRASWPQGRCWRMTCPPRVGV